MSAPNRRRRRVADVAVPIKAGPPIQVRPKSGQTFEVGPTPEEALISEVVAICRSADPEFFDLIRLAKSPLATLAAAEKILAAEARREAAERNAEVEALAADLGAPRPADGKPKSAVTADLVTTPVRFMLTDQPAAVLAAAGTQKFPIWRVTSDSFRVVAPVNASADAPAVRDEPPVQRIDAMERTMDTVKSRA